MTAIVRFAPTIAKARLHEIHDSLVLALDATEKRGGGAYAQTEREARGYIRAALRNTVRLMEAGA